MKQDLLLKLGRCCRSRHRVTRLLALSAFFIFVFLPISAQTPTEWEVEGLKYTVISSAENTVSVSGTDNLSGAVTIPGNVIRENETNEKVSYKVTEIAADAFKGKNLSEVTIPNTVSKIGGYAFSNCKLTEVTIPNTVAEIGERAFYNCQSLKSLTFSDSGSSTNSELTILYNSFEGTAVETLYIGRNLKFTGFNAQKVETIPTKNSLVSLTIGPGVTYPIEESAYEDHTHLTTVNIYSKSCEVGKSAFKGCTALATVKVGNAESDNPGLSIISDSAFEGCTSLASLELGIDVVRIHDYAFKGCINLAALTIPDRVNYVGDSAFEGCTSLASLKLGVAVGSIGSNAFKDCAKLTVLEIPQSVSSIGSSAFSGCTGVKTLKIEDADNVLNIFEDSFSGIALETLYLGRNIKTGETIANGIMTGGVTTEESLVNLTISGSVNSIAERAYANHLKLNNVTIGGRVGEVVKESFSGCSSLSSLTFTDSDKRLSIGESAFKDCVSLPLVDLPSRVSKIEATAFANCGKLKEVKFGDCESHLSISEDSFDGSPIEKIYLGRYLDSLAKTDDSGNPVLAPVPAEGTLRELTIDGYVTEVFDNQFTRYQKLVTVNLGNSVKTVGSSAFSGLLALTTVNIGNNLEVLGDNAFYKCSNLNHINFPDGLQTIGSNALSECIRLTEIKIPGTVTSIGSSAFSYCDKLASVIEIPKGVTKIEYGTFSGCSELTKVIIPENVTEIGSYAFYSCSSLNSINIPAGVKSIGDNAFSGCSNITEIEIPNNKDFIEISSGTFSGCSKLSSVVIPENVRTIRGSAFSGCTSLAELTIKEGVTAIDGGAFYGCSSLINVSIPNSVTQLQGDVFANCTDLTSVTIGSNVKEIDESTFANCPSLSVVIAKCDEPVKIKENTFGSNDFTVLYVPQGKKEIYANDAFWGKFKHIIDGIPSGDPFVIEDGVFYAPISESESYARSGSATTTAVDIKESISINGKVYPVTMIPSSGFKNCKVLSSVTIPGSVTSIGDGAFSGCESLQSLRLTDSDKFLNISAGAFEDDKIQALYLGRNMTGNIEGRSVFTDSEFTSVEIGNCVTSIPDFIFETQEKLTSIKIPENVTSIGERAFSGCSALQTLEILSSVTTIGKAAFSGCRALQTLEIPESVTTIGTMAFSGCNALQTLEIPSSVISIGQNAFSNNENLKELKICDGKDALEVGEYAFSSSPIEKLYYGRVFDTNGLQARETLKTLEIGKDIPSIPENAFSAFSTLTNLVIPDNVTSVGKEAFSGCSGLNSLSLGNGVKSIGENAFRDCSGLTSVDLGNGVNKIETGAFNNCSSITSIIIPDNTTEIGDYSFHGCRALQTLEIPSSVTSIGESAFSGCSALQSVEIPSSITFVGSYAFSNIESLTNVKICDGERALQLEDYAFSNSPIVGLYYGRACNPLGIRAHGTLKRLKIGNTVTSIPDYAFSSYSALTNLEISDNVLSIGEYAFYGCNALQSFEIPLSVTTIGQSAFYGCNLQQSLVIPLSVEFIGRDAFCGIENLKELIICDGTNALELDGLVFYGSPIEKLYYGREFDADGLDARGTLKILEIGKDVTSIPENAFNSYSALTSIVIPDNVTSIGGSAFGYCAALTSVTLGKNLATIGKNAFTGSDGVAEITSLNTTPPNIVDYFFGGFNYEDVTLYVPAGCVPAYEQANCWKEFFDIREIGSTDIPVKSIAIAGEHERTMKSNSTLQLSATVSPENAANKTIQWSSSDESIATVNASGLVSSKSTQGYVTITVSCGKVSDYIQVNVVETYAEAIEITASGSTKLKDGETVQLSAKVSPADADDKTVTWNSQDSSIATVNKEGLVTAQESTGTVTIEARCGNAVAYIEIEVIPTPVESVRVYSNDEVSGYDGYGVQLYAEVSPANATDQSLTWKSSDEQVATVDDYGNVVLHEKAGKATITATCGTVSGSIEVTSLGMQIQWISILCSESTTLDYGGKLQLKVAVYPDNASYKTVRWESSDETVVTVDSNGLVTAKEKEGTAKIYAYCGEFSGTLDVRVQKSSGVDSILADRSRRIKIFNMNGFMVYDGLAGDVDLDKFVKDIYIIRTEDGVSHKIVLR